MSQGQKDDQLRLPHQTGAVPIEEEDHIQLPPPAYGDTYGEIHDEKSGLGTTANVTGDGRVNIQINQLNQRLSKLLAPALHLGAQTGEQGNNAAPPPYTPPSLDGGNTKPPPPPLNVVIQVVGSRGDVQPFVALGKVLKNTFGHRVRLATHPTFKTFVEENDLEFFSIGGDPAGLMAFMVQNPRLFPGFRSFANGNVSRQRQNVAEYIQGCWRSCYQAGNGLLPPYSVEGESDRVAARPFVADCIIANPPSFAHIHCAERLSVPLHVMFTMPYSPTQAFPHPLANIQSSNADAQLTNYISFGMIELLSWQGLGEIINRFRVKCLGLDPVSLVWAPGMLHRLKIPHTYFWSPALIPKPKDWGSQIDVSGFCFLDLASEYIPSSDLVRFLESGPPPVYIGFGSIVLDDPDAMTELIFAAVRKTGQRVLLSKGWGGIGGNELHVPDGVFMLGNVPHDWLFKHVSCVVHHGGAGTTAAGIVASRPTVIVPFFGDQPFWGAMIAKAGTGPNPIPAEKLTSESLADAINFCLKSETQDRAKELATKVSAEKGSDVAAQSFHQHLDLDKLRCTLSPDRAAVWRIKRSNIRLSSFAACTLVNANLLDFQDLKLYKPCDYITDEGPIDPISGGFVAFVGAVGGMSKGLIDVPTETWKAAKLPFKSGSSSSKSLRSSESVESRRLLESRIVDSATSRSESQTSLGQQSSAARLYSPPTESSPSSTPPSSSSSAFVADESKESKSQSDSGKHRDMLKHTGAHGSKGLGRFATALAEGPMDIALGMNKGLYNLSKAMGDDTVRRPTQVTGFRSGAKAAGMDFGHGWYDGITGLVTQPWKGAQKDGTSGFFKGIGKGVGGFVTKPCATIFGVPGYMMKGVFKGSRKWFASNVQDHIFASRAAQGYEEWMKSSDAEKEDVLKQWEVVKEYLHKKHDSDEMLRRLLKAQHEESTRSREAVNLAPAYSPSSEGAVPPADQQLTEEATQREDIGEVMVEISRQPEVIDYQNQEHRTAFSSDTESARHDTTQNLSSKKSETSSLAGSSTSPKTSTHLAGTTQSEFEANQPQGEKTTQERDEEAIVLEYVKKQSLLERQHLIQCKNQWTDEDEEVRMALELSMRGYEWDAAHRYGESSRT